VTPHRLLHRPHCDSDSTPAPTRRRPGGSVDCDGSIQRSMWTLSTGTSTPARHAVEPSGHRSCRSWTSSPGSGDVDCTGAVDSNDAAQLASYVAGGRHAGRTLPDIGTLDVRSHSPSQVEASFSAGGKCGRGRAARGVRG
jgi:hypothetical protein